MASSAVTLDRLARVAQALRWMQAIFLSSIFLGFGIVAFGIQGSAGSAWPILLLTFALVGGVICLVNVYRAASGAGRSGLLWLLLVLFFKMIPMIILCFLTRRWLQKHNVKVTNLGFSYELPASLDDEGDAIGFTPF